MYIFVNHAVQEHGQCTRTCLYTRVAGSCCKQNQAAIRLDEIQPSGKYDLAEWLERLAVNAKVATVLGFDPSILRHCGIWGAADEAVLNNGHKKKNPKNPPL